MIFREIEIKSAGGCYKLNVTAKFTKPFPDWSDPIRVCPYIHCGPSNRLAKSPPCLDPLVQGLVLKPKLDFGKNLCFLVRTMWSYGFWVDVHKSTGTHRNFIIFRCACNAWTIITRKTCFQWKSSCFQVLSMVLPIIKRTRSISCRFYSIQRYT